MAQTRGPYRLGRVGQGFVENTATVIVAGGGTDSAPRTRRVSSRAEPRFGKDGDRRQGR